MLFGLKFVYLRLGMLRDAEAQFKSALKQQPMIATYLHLGRIVGFLRQDGNLTFTRAVIATFLPPFLIVKVLIIPAVSSANTYV